MVGINVTVDFEDLALPEIDDEAIERWIEARLNAARNLFIRNASRGGGGGRTYRRGRRGMHQASASAEYPATDSGRLVGSIDYEMRGPREGSLFSNVEYAKYLAQGTRYMDQRKMLTDALREVLADAPPLQGVGWK